MYNYYDTNPEKRQGWRNASQIERAALEHKKQWNQIQDEDALRVIKALLKAPLRLLQTLLG